jgi:EAL domain-containing protein (putative c-di-GMP-specific phosphodiesterase class I)
MYQAKGAGKARSAMFAEHVRAEVQERLVLVTDLRRAIDNDELDIVYQPIHDLHAGSVVSVEALVRWLHPTKGPISARDIIDLAEDNGAILAVGTWMLRHACEQLSSWKRTLGEAAPRYVAVNVSARQLSAEFIGLVHSVLKEYGLAGSDLCLELTESVLMVDAEVARTTLDALRACGVRLAIDDFGTGYSSLAYLERLPVELLKVDRTFVAGMVGGNVIVNAVLGLARALELEVVAEGVESPDQLEALLSMGCRYAQGYLLARPMSAAAVADHLVAVNVNGDLRREEAR